MTEASADLVEQIESAAKYLNAFPGASAAQTLAVQRLREAAAEIVSLRDKLRTLGAPK